MSKDFFRDVKNARKAKGLTLKQLASLTDISVGHLSEYENGKTGIEGEKLISICRVLDIDVGKRSGDVLSGTTESHEERGEANKPSQMYAESLFAEMTEEEMEEIIFLMLEKKRARLARMQQPSPDRGLLTAEGDQPPRKVKEDL